MGIAVLLWFWLPLAAVCTYAGARGGGPERVGATLLLSAAIATLIVRPADPHRYANVLIGVLAVDALLMVGLVWLAVRAARSWPIATAALHGISLLGHLGKAENVKLWALGYELILILPVPLIVLTLAVGTWTHQRRRRTFGVDLSWKD
jgi:predicted lysophospholipase L1 biosynthesis ABC-type transport system permease subunit